MRPTTLSLTLIVLCLAANTEANAQSGGPRPTPVAIAKPKPAPVVKPAAGKSAAPAVVVTPVVRNPVPPPDLVLTKRLGEINQQRTAAQKSGDAKLLAQANQREAFERRQSAIRRLGWIRDHWPFPCSP
jgi:hypothetical protein